MPGLGITRTTVPRARLLRARLTVPAVHPADLIFLFIFCRRVPRATRGTRHGLPLETTTPTLARDPSLVPDCGVSAMTVRRA